MKLRLTPAEAHAKGRQRATQLAAQDYTVNLKNGYHWVRESYLGAEHMDLEQELLKFHRRRMADEMDLTKFPECRGVREIVEAERRGFREVLDLPLAEAFAYDWFYFCSRYLNVHAVGKAPPPAKCTDIWFADTREGGPIHASNRDDVLFNYRQDTIQPGKRGGGDMIVNEVACVGGVSAAVLCDEAPNCMFPLDLAWLDTRDLRTVFQYVDFLDRYQEFWGPGNRIYVDSEWNFAATEKANVRMGVRYSKGWAAITACAYLTPEMNAFKRERDLVSFQTRGWNPHDNSDKAYWDGAERRYRRLMQLTEAEAARGATVLGAARVVLDHAVPFPDRVCLAGEQGHPDEKLQNWTLLSFSRCVSGPNRRCYFRQLDRATMAPIYQAPCHIIPGDDVVVKPEWQAELDAAGELGLTHP